MPDRRWRRAPTACCASCPHADLAAIDPIVTTGYVARNHGYLVYDTLYGAGCAVPPAAADGRGPRGLGGWADWTIRLRDGLRFHDGEPVRAGDCVARIRRWAARDGLGQTLMALTDESPPSTTDAPLPAQAALPAAAGGARQAVRPGAAS